MGEKDALVVGVGARLGTSLCRALDRDGSFGDWVARSSRRESSPRQSGPRCLVSRRCGATAATSEA